MFEQTVLVGRSGLVRDGMAGLGQVGLGKMGLYWDCIGMSGGTWVSRMEWCLGAMDLRLTSRM